MNKIPYISIIVPCYNGAEVIGRAIESIIAQNNDEIEMIIVNDGSNDNTEEACKKYKEYEFIHYYRTPNLGAGHARNYGISKANGIWISFLDSDDLYIENSMNKVIPVLREYEKNGIDVVYTPKTKGDMQMNNVNVTLAENIDQIRHIPKLEFWTGIYSKSFIDSKNIKFFEYKEQDIESAFRFRVFSNSPKAITDNNLAFYFQRDNPESNTHTWKKEVLYRVKAQIFLELLENNISKKDDAWLLRGVLKEVRNYYINCIKYGCSDVLMLKKVNLCYKKAINISHGIHLGKNKLKVLLSTKLLFIAGNTIGKRKSAK